MNEAQQSLPVESADIRRQIQAIQDEISRLNANGDSAEKAARARDALSAAIRALDAAEVELLRETEELAETRHRLEIERLQYQALFDFAPDAYIVTDPNGVIRNANDVAYQLLNFEKPFLIGKPLALYIAQKDLARFRESLSRLEMIPFRQEWEFCVRPRVSAPFDALLSVGWMEADAAVQRTRQSLRWLIRDITEQSATKRLLTEAQTELEQRVEQRTLELRAANARLQQEIGERERAQRAEHEQRGFAEALRDTALSLTGALSLTEVLDKVLNNLRKVIVHDAAAVVLFDKNGISVVRSRHTHPSLIGTISEEALAEQAISALKTVIEQRVPFVASGWDANDNPLTPSLPSDRSYRSAVGLPLRVQDEVIGLLLFLSEQAEQFIAAQLDYLQAFAATAASAIRNVMLHEQSRALARADERQRFARELHDAVTQTLFTASLIADSLPYLWKQDPLDALEQVEQIKSLNRGALAEMRTLLLELRPEHLAKVELVDHLKRLVAALQARKHVEVDMTIEDGDPLPYEVRFAFYRIAQEAINNIVKHARATRVQIRFVSTGTRAELSISDNGVGFVKRQTSMGVGIENMHERADAISARLKISSRRSHGTTVTVVWSRE